MWKKRLAAFMLIIAAGVLAFYADVRVSVGKENPYFFRVSVSHQNYKLGLDLNGGAHLVYKADTSKLAGSDIGDAMTALRDVIERRVNLFGVSEPIVQTEKGGVVGGGENRLIVELPGVTDVAEAVKLIGQTPLLEFKLVKDTKGMSEDAVNKLTPEQLFTPTALTGRFLTKARLDFDQDTGEPKVILTFNSEGQKLFAQITKENINRILAIFLDGQPISTPVIREEINSGDAVISGGFKIAEAKLLARNLNYGALPVPIELVSTQTIGASLGEDALRAGIRAGIIAYIIISLFLILWYRLPGLVAVLSLLIYVFLNLLIFKFLVTLTAAGIAGFILSIGMAVDANILIFERVKEELRGWKSMPAQGGSAYSGGKEELARGRSLPDAIKEGFARAWTSIRDSNLSSIITAVILYWFASTSLIKGFALVFFIGVMTSMFTAIVASRTLLVALGVKGESKAVRFLFDSGVR
ncbi:MAG: protein translocase subunit SecD [Candidatus Taylorbacteria bacterium]|nr:protein translocase subunit SecD [Candidatus Taylorbacteria bacterium]